MEYEELPVPYNSDNESDDDNQYGNVQGDDSGNESDDDSSSGSNDELHNVLKVQSFARSAELPIHDRKINDCCSDSFMGYVTIAFAAITIGFLIGYSAAQKH